MSKSIIFNFKTDISNIKIPSELNNPFGTYVPEIAKIAAEEFQNFITEESDLWKHEVWMRKGKMWGVLVIQRADSSYGFLGAVSGKLPENMSCEKLTPSVFDDSTDDYFINKGMTELTVIGTQIKNSENSDEISELKEFRKNKSIGLQRRLFENYNFINLSGQEQNLLEIFKNASNGNPPAAAGECAAPKLLQHALQNNLKPVAITEFWMGNSLALKQKQNGSFYPACRDRCRLILEYMLEDNTLFDNRFSVEN